MPFCDQCAEQKDSVRVCSRCKAARYCGKDCQQAAWKMHKKSCNQPATSAASSSEPSNVPAVLLGRSTKADAVLVPKGPFTVANVRHLFTMHRRSKDSDFVTMPMPFTKRLFHRDIHIIFDRSMLGESVLHASAENNTFATRAAAALSSGFGPPIRNQALLFDPTGAPYHMGDFLAYDDVVYNYILDRYTENWTSRAPRELELDGLGRQCREIYQNYRSNYTDAGVNIPYKRAQEEMEEDEACHRTQ